MVVSSLTPLMPLAIFVHCPGLAFELLAQRVENDAPLFGIVVGVERRHRAGLLELERLVHEQRRVAAVVEDHRRAAAVGPHQRFHRAPPVFGQRLALPREHRRAPGVLHRAAGFGTADDHRRGGGSCVEKMLQLTQRTSAPSAVSVSISTAVCTVMCSEPMIFAPASGCLPA